MFKLTMHIAATLIAALLSGYFLVASIRFEAFCEVPFGLAIIYLIIVVGRASKTMSYGDILHVSISASILANIFYELLALLWFPGIINYIPFLSLANIIMYLMLVSGLSVLLFLSFSLLKFALAQTVFRNNEKK